MTAEQILAQRLVALLQVHVQQFGPIPDAAGDALKTALDVLQRHRPRRKKETTDEQR